MKRIFSLSIISIIILVLALLAFHVISESPEIIPASFKAPPEPVFNSIPILQDLEKNKINVTTELLSLEYSLSILDKKPDEARSIALEAYKNLSRIYEEKDVLIRERRIKLAGKVSLSALTIALLIIAVPKVYLKAWYRFNRKRVLIKSDNGKPSFLFDEEVQAVMAAIIVIGIVFSIAQVLAPSNPEPFSEIGLLGAKKKIGDYPKDVVKGENITLYIYVGNHLGNTTLYRIDFKIDASNNTMINQTETPLNITPVQSIYVLLGNNQTTIIPFSFTINTTGKVRLVWEMYVYEPETKSFVYHKRWVHLWINVLSPSVPGG